MACNLLKGLKLPQETSNSRRENIARAAAAHAAIKAIERRQHDMGQGRSDASLAADAGARLMDLYRKRIDGRPKPGEKSCSGSPARTACTISFASSCARST